MRLVLIGGLCLLSCFATVIAQQVRVGPAIELPPEFTAVAVAQTKADAKIRAMLVLPTSVDFDETPLAEVVAALVEQHNINIILDGKALEEAGMATDTPITCQFNDVLLCNALRLLLRPLDLTYCVGDGVLHITTVDAAQDRLVTVVYPVGDLVKRTGIRPQDFNSLMNLITWIVAPTIWQVAGGQGALVPLRDSQSLVISQTDEVHTEIAMLLDNLRESLRASPPTPQPNIAHAVDTQRQQTEKVRKSLAAFRSFHMDRIPIKVALNELASQAGVQLMVDEKSLEEAGLDLQSDERLKAVSLHVNGVPIAQAVSKLLSPFDLTYWIDNEIVVVTTTDAAQDHLSTEIYPVADLVGNRSEPVGSSQLIDVITRTITPTTWEQGAIILFRGMFIVSQTEDAQQELKQFLARMRLAISATGPGQ